MKVELVLLRTRVARRMLLLFLACAIGPVVTLGAAAYFVVAHNLKSARADQMHQDGNIAGQLILGHLQDLASELRQSQAPGVAEHLTFTSGSNAAAHGEQFSGMAIESAPGVFRRVGGTIDQVPSLDAVRAAQLSAGRPALVVRTDGRVPGVFIAVPAMSASPGGYPRVWGYLPLSRVLGGVEGVRDGTQLCYLQGDRPLACVMDSRPVPASAVIRSVASSDVLTRSVFLKYEFAAPAWTFTLTQVGGGALEALPIFRRLFFLGVLFTVLLVFTLSHSQIRQRMTPLADLEAGTRRLRAGDFTTRVMVESGDEFQSLAGSFNRMASDLERQFATLSAMHSVDQAALEHRSTEAISAAALSGAPALLGVHVVALATPGAADPTTWNLDIVTGDEPSARKADIKPTKAELAELSTIADYLPITERQLWPTYCRALRNHGCERFVVFPLHGQERAIGVLVVGLPDEATAPEEMFVTARQLADQLALGLSNVSLVGELSALSVGALTALARTVDAASHWTGGHSERVTVHAVEIGRRMGLDEADLTRLRQGGLLHDIGKIGVPAAILDKPAGLTDEELAIMQSHPTIGAKIVESVPAFRELVPLVLHHHELLDGSGYPHQLSGDQIPELVRILTVADVFDALVSDRPYRRGLAPEIALGILVKGVETKFDPRPVAALREMVVAGWAPSRRNAADAETDLPEADRRMLIGVRYSEAAA